MARPAQITREILAPLIRARGPVSATELASLLTVNRTTIARTLPDFGNELVTLGGYPEHALFAAPGHSDHWDSMAGVSDG